MHNKKKFNIFQKNAQYKTDFSLFESMATSIPQILIIYFKRCCGVPSSSDSKALPPPLAGNKEASDSLRVAVVVGGGAC